MTTTMQTEQGRQGTSGVQRCGRGSLERVGDVRVLRVAGSDYDMGLQHGTLLRDDVRRGPLPYFRGVVEKLVGAGSLGPASKLVWPTLQQTVGRRVARNVPGFVRDTIRGLADGAGLREQDVLDGCTMPDSMLWVVARAMQIGGRGPAVAHRIGLELGCTSAVAWGGATKDGAMLHARNFDYHGVGCWPDTKTVIFHAPDDGQRYVSVAAAGIALGGITAMNEAGLTLTVHQHMFSEKARLGGLPIGIAGDLVMRHAKTLDEARAILEAHRPIGCWTYVMTDGPRREAMLVEQNPERQAVHRYDGDEGTVGYANVYLDPELGKSETAYYGTYWRHNAGRHRQVNALLEAQRGALDPEAMAEILGDTGSGECRVRDSIAMVMTVGSVVFRPEDGTVWVGTGDAPTSRGTYQPFTLGKEGHAVERGTLEVGRGEAPAARDAFELFRQAYLAYVDGEDAAAARACMEQASLLAPEQSIYAYLAGLYALVSGDAAGAEVLLDRAIAVGHVDPERVAAFHLWRGRARDVLGRRDGAQDDYRSALGRHADQPVYRAARRGLRRRYTAAAARRVHVDAGLADVVSP